MARKRIQSTPFTGANQNFGNSELLDQLTNLAMLENQPALGGDESLAGTAKLEPEAPAMFDFPRVPNNPAEYEDQDQFGVDDVPGIPEGIELLGDLAGAEAEEDALDEVAMTQPPLQPPQTQPEALEDPMENIRDREQAQPEMTAFAPQEEPKESLGFWGSIGQGISDYFSPQKRKEVSESNARLFEDNRLRNEAKQEGLTLDEYKTQRADEYVQDQQSWEDKIEEAVQEPYTRSVYGATDTVLNTPSLRENLQQIGIDPNPEEERMLKDMDAALSDMNDEELQAQGAWNEQVARIRQRIDSGNTSDMDKFLIGLTLAMPLIIGGIFGAEAGASFLGGMGQGLMDIYKLREKAYQDDEDRLSEITGKIEGSKTKQKEIELKRAQLPQEVKKAIGEGPLEHLKGMTLVTLTDDEGNEMQGVRLKPGIVAEMEYMTDKDSKKEMMKEATELNQNRAAVNKLGNNARKIIEIAQQIDDPNVVGKIFQSWAKGKKPSVVAKFGQDITLDGRKVNSAVALTQILEDTLEARRNVMKIKNFGPQLFEHFERILTNPTGEFTTPQDLIDQSLRLYTDTRDQFLDEAEQRGFIKAALLDDFYGKDKQMYDRLNKKESRGRELGDKRQLMTEQVEVPDA